MWDAWTFGIPQQATPIKLNFKKIITDNERVAYKPARS